MSTARHHAEWLSLVEVSGPFLSMPVLMRVFPQGLVAHDPDLHRNLRMAHEEWEDSQENHQPNRAIHREWVKFVLGNVLELPDEVIAEGQKIQQTLHHEVREHDEDLHPDLVVVNPPGRKDAGKARLLVQVYPASQDLEHPVAGRTWKASPDTRMMELLHATNVRLGLVTNGERWMLVDAPRNETTGYASWYSMLWLEEAITLRAFRSLLSIERFFGVADDDTLELLLAESAQNQQEVTDQLGYQVRRAVEVLIQSLDQADQDHGRQLLGSIQETDLYEAALTVMMRLVFLFCAEERGLMLLDDEIYADNYAVSTLQAQLRETADQQGEEILERRHDAWCRLLSTFRAVYGGTDHDRLKMPAYAGRLFNPDRFAFLEGRRYLPSPSGRGAGGEGGSWRDTPADPLPVNNRTVLHLLEALQFLQIKVPGGGQAESRRLSFRALDIEQIGHVYEGLLDHTAKRAEEPILGLAGTKDKEPEIALAELERQQAKGEDELLGFLKDETGRSVSALKKALAAELGVERASQFQAACGNAAKLWERVKPFAGLVRNDTFDHPVVITKGSVFVTEGTDRRSSGTHYTPTSLTEPIVRYTLEPLVYVGPAEGKPKEEWKLRSAKELLDLKICDMACGSGAFLVQACRYMAERLVEAWEEAEWRVVSGEWRDKKGEADGGSTLSGTEGLAGGHGLGGGLLRGDEEIPQGGTVRHDQSDSPGGGLDSGEHCRRAGTAKHEGVSQLPQHRTGITDGIGDPSAAESAGGITARLGTGDGTEAFRRNQPGAFRTASDLGAQTLASRHSPLGTRHPCITPFGLPSTGAPGEQLVPADTKERMIYARRIVAQRCLYGVDKNPLAADMAKLSLWLLTMQKDKPFTFLDHAIRSGDSLVGIANTHQLTSFSLDGNGPDMPIFTDAIKKRLEAVRLLRRQIAELADNSAEDVEKKVLMLQNADQQTQRLAYAANFLLAACWEATSETDRDERLKQALVQVEYNFKDLPVEQLEAEGKKRLREVGCPKPFHWPLEFPEVFMEGGGFDAIVGNPPFMGGLKLETALGARWRALIVKYLARGVTGVRGTADLCSYFFLRAGSLLSEYGAFGLLATNTIAQGDSHEVGLSQLVSAGPIIYRAVQSCKWPGTASLEVSCVWCCRQDWKGRVVLNDEEVSGISSYLTVAGSVAGKPFSLLANGEKAFQGSVVVGMGFILEPCEAEFLLGKDARHKRWVLPYLNGDDINFRCDQSASRWVINVFDTPLDRTTAPSGYRGDYVEDFPDIFRLLTERVRAERLAYPPTNAWNVRIRNRWWQLAAWRPNLYVAITDLKRVLIRARVSEHHMLAFVKTGIVMSDATVAFAFDSHFYFGVLQSGLHEVWARYYSSSLETRMRYTPVNCFESFSFPRRADGVDGVAEGYHEHRRQIMLTRQEGLTKTYNRFHDPDETAKDIRKLRELHVEMDNAVAAAYGWTDLDLGHGFHETKQGLRFTINEAARREVLARLLKLNHERYAEEVKQGLHDKGKKGGGKKKAGGGRTKKAAEGPGLF